MDTSLPTKTQIHQLVDRLHPEQLVELRKYLDSLIQEPIAPLYRVHEQAISTGVTDLADQHDRYLYGSEG